MKLRLGPKIKDYIYPTIGLLILTLFYVLVTYFQINPIISFVNSPYLSAVVTLVVGLFAFALYKRQQIDNKHDAANILLIEIQNAESTIRLLQQKLSQPIPELPENVVVMPTESWSKYKYLFVGDFDRSQWDAISNFYGDCGLLDVVLQSNNSNFQRNEEQYRANIQKISAEYTYDQLKNNSNETSVTNEKIEDELRTKINTFTDLYLKVATLYKPQKIVNDAKVMIAGIDSTLSRTSVGSVLKKFVSQE